MRKNISIYTIPLAIVLFLLLCMWYLLGESGYSLTTRTVEKGAIEIQTLSLGEYYSPVTSLVIYESDSGIKVVSLTAKSEESRMHTVTIKEGVNGFSDYYLDGYTIKYHVPLIYKFKVNTKYKVKVKWGWRENEKPFVLGAST